MLKQNIKRINIDVNKIQTLYIIKAGAIMILIAMLIMIDGILTVYIGSKMAAKLSKTLRDKVFKKWLVFQKRNEKLRAGIINNQNN